METIISDKIRHIEKNRRAGKSVGKREIEDNFVPRPLVNKGDVDSGIEIEVGRDQRACS